MTGAHRKEDGRFVASDGDPESARVAAMYNAYEAGELVHTKYRQDGTRWPPHYGEVVAPVEAERRRVLAEKLGTA